MQSLDKEIMVKLTQIDIGLVSDVSQNIFLESLEKLSSLLLVMEQNYAFENYKIFHENESLKVCLNSLQIKIQNLLCKESFLCYKSNSFTHAAKLVNKIHSVLVCTGARNSAPFLPPRLASVIPPRLAPVLPPRSIKISQQVQFDTTSNTSEISHSKEAIAQETVSTVKSSSECHVKCSLNAYWALDAICNKVGSFKDFNAFVDNMKLNSEWRKYFKINYDVTSSQRLTELSPYELRGYDRETLYFLFSLASEDKRFDAKCRSRFKNYVEIFTTKTMNIPPSNVEVLKKGALNTVYAVTFFDEIAKENIKMVFKPDPADLPKIKLWQEEFFGTSVASGIPPGIDSHLTSRAVASSIVDQLLNGENPISVKTEFVIVNGQRGVLMEYAKGECLKLIDEEKLILSRDYFKRKIEINVLSKCEESSLETMLNIRKRFSGRDYCQRMDDFHKDWNQRQLRSHTPFYGSYETGKCSSDYYLKWLAVARDLRHVEIVYDSRVEATKPVFNINLVNPITLEGLINLQIKDIITGECDRHPQNYLIAPDGKVIGIDEDCCFGEMAIPADGLVRQQPSLKGIVPNSGSLMLNMPLVVTMEMKNKVMQLWKSREVLANALVPYISTAEIEATLNRLKKLLNVIHANDRQGRVVKSREELMAFWNTGLMNTNNNYAKREIHLLEKECQGWNKFREHREI